MTLSNWLDNELGGAESARIRAHLDECRSCRERVIAWFVTEHSTAEACTPVDEVRDERGSSACLDPETLSAYSEGEIQAQAAAGTEQHLLACTVCTSEVRRLIRLKTALGTAEPPRPSTRFATAPRRRDLALVFRDQVGRFFRGALPAAGALATIAALLIVIEQSSFTAKHPPVLHRGSEARLDVQLIADVVARARPAESEPLVALLPKGTAARLLEERGTWTRIELTDGRRVWVESSELTQVQTEPEEIIN